jgi:phage terminase large subunit-like protein
MPELAPPPMPRGGEAFGAWWDEAAAQAACDFFPRFLVHTEAEWAGRPFILADWQRDAIVRPIYGWKRADGSRLIRIVWLEVPRKNGKTELAAGLSLLMLLGDAEHGGQVYSLAVDKAQAKIVFDKAAVMVGYNRQLGELIQTYKTSLFCAPLLASFKPLAAGSGGKHGFSPTGAIGDEVHEWTDGGELADVVHKGTAARRQPLEIYITTAGVLGFGYADEMHQLALQVLSGDVVDPTFLPVIYSAPDPAAWRSETAWRAANPNYGVSVKPDYIAREAEKAARSPRAENDFKRFHLNLWTEQVTRWLPMEGSEDAVGWVGCTEDRHNARLWDDLTERLAGRICYGGLDLAVTTDITSTALLFPPEREGERWTYLWRFWLPEAALRAAPMARRKRYEHFAAIGALTVTGGNVTDFGLVRKAIVADAALYRLQWLGIDRYNAAQLATDLKDDDGLPVAYFGQGFVSMSAPTKQFERLVTGGEMEHGNNPVARWMAANAVVDRDAADNLKPTKARAADKIDGIVAAIMALGGALANADTGDVQKGFELL